MEICYKRGDRARARLLAAGSAVRQLVPNLRLPGIDPPSPNFRLTRWYAPKQLASGLDWYTVLPKDRITRLPGNWGDVVVVSAEAWDEDLIKRSGGADTRRAVAYRLGETAIMVGDVVEVKSADASHVAEDGLAGASHLTENSTIHGVALRLGNGPLHVALGQRNVGTDRFYQSVGSQELTVEGPFPQNELQTKHPGVVLL